MNNKEISISGIHIVGYHHLLDSGNRQTYHGEAATLHFYKYPVTLTCAGRSETLQPQSAALVAGNQRIHYDSPVPGEHYCFHFHFKDEKSEKRIVEDWRCFDLRHGFQSFLEQCENIQKRLASPSPWQQQAALSAMSILLYELIDADEESQAPRLSKAEKAVQKIKEWVDRNPQENFLVRELAAKVEMDENYLTRCFREQHGRSIQQYIISKRLEKACYYLQQTSLPIKAIASDTGFYDAQHFYRHFKKKYQTTPKQYRDRSKG